MYNELRGKIVETEFEEKKNSPTENGRVKITPAICTRQVFRIVLFNRLNMQEY